MSRSPSIPTRTPLTPSGRAQPRALRNQAALQIAPQRHHQLAGNRDDADAPNAALQRPDPLHEPRGKGALGRLAHPQPSQLDRQRAGARIAALADPLLAPALSAVIGRAGQAEVTAHLTAIVEGPVEHLAHQKPRADRADPDQLLQLRNARLLRTKRVLLVGCAVRLKRGDLPVEQADPLVLAPDLGLGGSGRPSAVRIPTRRSTKSARRGNTSTDALAV